MTQDSRHILIQPNIHLCTPQTSQKWQPASLCHCMAPVPLLLPWPPVACQLQGWKMLLCIYFIAAGLCLHLRGLDRGRLRGMRNLSPAGPSEYISVTNIGSVKKGLLFYEAFPSIYVVFWHRSMCHYYAFRRKKFTSIRVKCAALWRPDGWYSVS